LNLSTKVRDAGIINKFKKIIKGNTSQPNPKAPPSVLTMSIDSGIRVQMFKVKIIIAIAFALFIVQGFYLQHYEIAPTFGRIKMLTIKAR